MKRLLSALALIGLVHVAAYAGQTVPVPGGVNAAGLKVLTFVNKEPPGVRCNGNTQVAAEIANVYKVPIQILPASLASHLPAPSVFYGNEMIAADGGEHNGQSTFQIVADALDMEGAPKLSKTGLLFQEKVRHEFDDLKAIIKNGGR